MSRSCAQGHPVEGTGPCPTCGGPVPDTPAGARTCPNCASYPQVGPTCAECGFRFDGTDSVPVWEEQHWEVMIRPDRQYYEMIEPDGMEFPAEAHGRRLALQGDLVRIGRRSRSAGTAPEIDLSGSIEDIGVSKRHAVLMRQPNGSWALADQDSTNGTFVNYGEDPIPPNQRVPLGDGDRVHVGAWTTLTVERVDASGTRSVEISTPSKDTRAVARGRKQLDLRLLGPLELVVGGETVPVGAPKARAVLALLALRAGSSVSVGEFETALWGESPPPSANVALRGYISELRKLLPEGAVEFTTARGYRLTSPKEAVDLVRFERRATQGRTLLASGHPGLAVAELTGALELWRGEPLVDLADATTGAAEVTRLLEMRASAEEDRFEGRLQLGDHHGVVPDLQAACEDQPLRERRRGQLMLALYRSGRQPEALRAFQRLYDTMAEEFGLEPSEDLKKLESAIVLERPELRWTPPAEAGVAPAPV